MTDSTWNHNTHFHTLALALVTPQTTALDVGCGEGLLTREIAGAGARHVVGLDLDPDMVATARERADGTEGLEYRVGDVLTSLTGERFDLVTSFATLHHLDLGAGLRRLAELTAPGGRLVVVGLARASGAADLALAAATTVVDPIVKARRGYWEHPAPVAEPRETYADVESVAARALPGCRFRRRLYYRYSLEWRAPAAG